MVVDWEVVEGGDGSEKRNEVNVGGEKKRDVAVTG